MITRKSLQKKIYKSDAGVLTSAFGTPRPGGRTHAGEDWDVTIRDDHPKLYAPANGVITYVRNQLSTERGKIVEIKIGAWYLFIQHLYKVSVTKGERVEAGQLIAIQGGSGTTLSQYASHVHIEFARYPYGDPRRRALNPNLYFYPLFSVPKYGTKTVVVSNLNIRAGHSLDAEKVGIAGKQAYTIYETVTEDGYIWGRIDWVEDHWIALKSVDGKQVFAK